MEKKKYSRNAVSAHKRIDHKKDKSIVSIWQASTAILGLLLIISIFIGGIGDGSTDSSASILNGDVVADSAVNFINENLLQDKGTAKLQGVEESNGMYLLKLDIDGQEMKSYVSTDGALLFPQAIDLTKKPELPQPSQPQTASSSLQKSNKPQVELFVMSHCPYGTQMEKGILPVIKKLGDKIDFELKFVNYAMHPTQGEVEEQLNQYCVQKEFNNKYLAYLGKFLESGDGVAALNSVGLKKSDISQCVSETDKQFDVIKNLDDKASWASGRFPKFLIHDVENKQYGIQGSPTLVINGQQAQSGRNAQSILDTICSSFTNKPKECGSDLSSLGNPAPGFGFGTQGGSATSAGCGA